MTWRDRGPNGYRHYYQDLGDDEVLRGPSVTTVCGWACDRWPMEMWRASRMDSDMAGDPDQFTWYRAQQGTLAHWRCLDWLGEVFGDRSTARVEWGDEEMAAHEALCDPEGRAPGSQNVLKSVYFERGHLGYSDSEVEEETEDWEGNIEKMQTFTDGIYHPDRLWHEAMQTVEYEILPMFRCSIEELRLESVRHVERMVFSTFDKYGGQYDFYGECEDGTVMADLKTGKAGFKSQFMQLAAYARASTFAPDRLAIVRCDPRAGIPEIHYLRDSRFTRQGLLEEFDDALRAIRGRYYD